MDWMLEPQLWIAFITLVALELVLGVDNVIFISILAGKLPTQIQQKARVIGLSWQLSRAYSSFFRYHGLFGSQNRCLACSVSMYRDETSFSSLVVSS
jgi:hypothetical protein